MGQIDGNRLTKYKVNNSPFTTNSQLNLKLHEIIYEQVHLSNHSIKLLNPPPPLQTLKNNM